MSDLLEWSRHPVFRGLSASAVIYVLLWSYSRRASLSQVSAAVLRLAAIGIACVGLGICVYLTLTNIAAPREWDFLCFWLYGRALAGGASPYDVAVLQELAVPFETSEGFRRVLYCLYPPPCVAQFWPLGLLPISVAAGLWYLVQWSAVAGVVVLLRRLVDPDRTRTGLAFSAALVFALEATLETFRFAQSNFLIVALAMAAAAASSPASRGLLLGFTVIVKPIGALLGLHLLVKRKWASLAAMCIPAALCGVLFVALQGWTGLARYRDRNPVADEISQTYYTEPMNQSLLAALLRRTDAEPGSHPLFHPPYVALAAVATLVTMAAVWRLPQELGGLGLAASMSLAVLIYPGTLAHYSVYLLVPIGLLFRHRERLIGGGHVVPVAAALAYGFTWAELAFFANLMIWVVVASYGLCASQRSAD